MAINFPDNPSNGDTHEGYTYNSTKNTWTPAASPSAVVEYATVDLLPGTADAGDLAFVTATNRLYIWNGSGWYNIALINTNPTISGVSSSYTLASDGTPTTVTITATDPEGIPITYSIASDTSGNVATVTQGTGSNSNVFTITPTTNTANAGSFSLTFRASDGVNIATAPATFTLQFFVQNSNYTTSLITTAGSAGTNSTFTDSSSSSQSLTVYGNTTQTSFSPYRSGGYSTYFDGSGDYYTVPNDLSLGTNDFTFEFWIWPDQDFTSVAKTFINTETSGTGVGWSFNQSTYNGYNGLTFAYGVYGSYTVGRYIDNYWLPQGEWTHIAAQRRNGVVEIYVNGVSQTLSTYNQSGTFSDGADLTNSQTLRTFFNGVKAYVSDLRLVVGSYVYDGNFTPSTERLTAITNTSLLTCHLPYLADGSTNDHTITVNGDVSTKPFGPYDYQEYAVGNHGGSTYFDGTGDYIQVGTNVLPAAYDTDWTVEFWMYPSTMADRGDIFSQYSAGIVGRMAINTQTDNTIKFFQNGLSPAPLSSSANIYANQWYHVAVVNSSGTRTLYVNGKSQGTATGTSSMDTTNTQIGQTPTQDNFEGNISDLRVVNGTAVYTADFTPPTAPLSAVTNTNLFINGQGAKILDKSQSVTNLTLAGDTTASTAQYKYLPTSIYFDGNDYLNVEDFRGFASGEDWTIESWVWLDFSQTRETLINFIPHHTIVISLNRTGSGDTYIFLGNGSSWVGSPAITSSSNLSAQTWHHVALVNNSGTITLYHDGTSVGSTTAQPSGFNGGYNLGAITGYTTERLKGYLSDFRITKGLARYTANFTPPTAALQG